jgi:hypothetical protein
MSIRLGCPYVQVKLNMSHIKELHMNQIRLNIYIAVKWNNYISQMWLTVVTNGINKLENM